MNNLNISSTPPKAIPREVSKKEEFFPFFELSIPETVKHSPPQNFSERKYRFSLLNRKNKNSGIGDLPDNAREAAPDDIQKNLADSAPEASYEDIYKNFGSEKVYSFSITTKDFFQGIPKGTLTESEIKKLERRNSYSSQIATKEKEKQISLFNEFIIGEASSSKNSSTSSDSVI